MLGPKERMTKKAKEALIRRFDKPLLEDDINAMAKLTRMDKEVIRVAVGLIGPDGVAEEAKEHRQLSAGERALRKGLKLTLLGLSAIERCRKRQASRLTWLRAADAPTKFFMSKIYSKMRRNFIHLLNVSGVVLTSNGEKEEAIREHFVGILGSPQRRATVINWELLDLPTFQGGGLDNPFTKVEVWMAISPTKNPLAPMASTEPSLDHVGESSNRTLCRLSTNSTIGRGKTL
ncbi:hypothetical protein D1007_26683 [Hordeum vulgare]|nr:hypothetical protein D1007_26683 [Hordeum vulgare]